MQEISPLTKTWAFLTDRNFSESILCMYCGRLKRNTSPYLKTMSLRFHIEDGSKINRESSRRKKLKYILHEWDWAKTCNEKFKIIPSEFYTRAWQRILKLCSAKFFQRSSSLSSIPFYPFLMIFWELFKLYQKLIGKFSIHKLLS